MEIEKLKDATRLNNELMDYETMLNSIGNLTGFDIRFKPNPFIADVIRVSNTHEPQSVFKDKLNKELCFRLEEFLIKGVENIKKEIEEL